MRGGLVEVHLVGVARSDRDAIGAYLAGVHGEGGAGVLGRVGVTALYIEPGSPWENGYIECFNGKLGDRRRS